MSKSERTSDEIEQTRRIVWARARGRCQICGSPLTWGEGEMAHMVANNRVNLVKASKAVCKYLAAKDHSYHWYGDSQNIRLARKVLNHPRNLRWTCPGKCNDSAMIGMKGEVADLHIAAIIEEMLGGQG